MLLEIYGIIFNNHVFDGLKIFNNHVFNGLKNALKIVLYMEFVS